MKNVNTPNPLTRVISLLRTGPRPILQRFYEQLIRVVRGYPVWSLTRITGQLYVGGQHRKHGWHDMQAEGITAIINLRETRHDDVAKDIGGQRHLHLPTRDNTPPSLADLQRGVEFIAEEIEQGGKVFIHCGLGVGRAPTMAAAYLISTGMTPDEAITKIRSVRPFVHLTTAQRAQLDIFANALQIPDAPHIRHSAI